VRRVSLLVLLLSLGLLAGCGGSGNNGGGGNNNPPPPVTLQSITVTTNLATIAPGTTTQFVATGTFSDNSTQVLTSSVTWSSSDNTKATVSNTAGTFGLAQGVAAGQVQITAKQGSVTSAPVTLTVTNASISSIALSPANPTIDFGTQQQFTATGTFSDGSTQDISNVCTWTSGTPAVASITKKSGLATSNTAPGSTVITATFSGTPGTTNLSVTLDNMVSIAVTPGSAQIAQGTQLQFDVTGTFNDGRTLDVSNLVSSWTTTNAGLTSIAGGLAVAAGSVASPQSGTVTATVPLTTQPALTGQANLTVNNATLTNLTISPSGSTIQTGATLGFSAVGQFSFGPDQVLTTQVAWNSDAPTIASFGTTSGKKNVVTGNAAGTANITANMLGVTSQSVPVTVTSATLSSINVKTVGNPFTTPGGTVQFKATGTYSDGSTQNVSKQSTWTSSDTSVATVTQTGFAFGQGAGQATITAKQGSITGTATIVVTPSQLVSIAIQSPNAGAKLANNTSVQLSVIGTFADGTTQDLTQNSVWSSNAPAIATVGSSTGVVRGLSVGGVTITAKFGSLSATINLNVTNATLSSVAVSTSSPSISQGGQSQFKAVASFSDGSTQVVTTFANWSSSNTSIAVIDSNGLATTAGGTGTVSITGAFTQSSTTQSGTASLTVN
jgi:trimeric autotransporter adhesin